MKPILLTSFILLMISVISCGDKKKERLQNETKKEQKMDEDTTFTSPPQPEPAPAPGTAVVLAKINSYATSAAGAEIELMIKEIKGYGAGTPLLSANSTISPSISKRIIEEKSKLLKPDHTVIVTLESSQPTLQLSNNKSSKWRIIDLESN